MYIYQINFNSMYRMNLYIPVNPTFRQLGNSSFDELTKGRVSESQKSFFQKKRDDEAGNFIKKIS